MIEHTDQQPVLLAIAADIVDAVDPNLSPAVRLAAARRAAEHNPVVAVALATQYTHGMLARLADCDPAACTEAMRKLRETAAQVGA